MTNIQTPPRSRCPSAEGYWLCPDHKRAHEDEQRQGDGEFDEHGRNKAVMRNVRAM